MNNTFTEKKTVTCTIFLVLLLYMSMQVSHHNHGKDTLDVGVQVIKHQRNLRMQSFNNYRKRFGLEPYKSFEEMTGE